MSAYYKNVELYVITLLVYTGLMPGDHRPWNWVEDGDRKTLSLVEAGDCYYPAAGPGGSYGSRDPPPQDMD